MVKMKVLLKIWIITSVLGLFVIIFWLSHKIQSPKEAIESAIDTYRIEEYKGIITDKFIDKNEHNFKKVFIKENNRQRIILFDIEASGVYNYFEIGDSLIKNRGSLQIRVLRNQTDTTLQMKFVEY